MVCHSYPSNTQDGSCQKDIADIVPKFWFSHYLLIIVYFFSLQLNYPVVTRHKVSSSDHGYLLIILVFIPNTYLVH